MEEEKSSTVEKNINLLSSSSSSDMRDWELFESDLIPNKKGIKLYDNFEEKPEQNMRPSGLFVHEDAEKHSGVEDLLTDDNLHNESNSSSDIDIIEECAAENSEDCHNNTSISSMDISFCPSEISTSLTSTEGMTPTKSVISGASQSTEQFSESTRRDSGVAPVVKDSSFFTRVITVLRLIIDGINAFHGDRMSAKDYFVIGFVISLCMIIPCTHIVLHKASWQEAKLEQMEGHVNKLMTENEHLKSKVLAKIESGKLFGELDEEVKDLKMENFKLHKAMQTVIQQLEEQTNAIKKGLDMKENMHKDPYKREIFKLKEQINLLRFDNEELQKQLVRIRYGKYPLFRENKDDTHEKGETKPKSSPDEALNNKEKPDSSFKEKSKEIDELGKKLNEEVAKLKNWKKSLEDFVNEIENPQVSEESQKIKQDKHENKRSQHHEKHEEKIKHKKNKNRKFYHWSWKDIQQNFKGTLERFPDVSDMISKYVLIDKNKVNGVLDTITHYYRKAQDKTQEILESYSVDEKTQNVKNDIWTLMGEMKNKWNNMKDEFMENHFGNSNSDENEAPESTNFPHKDKSKTHQVKSDVSIDSESNTKESQETLDGESKTVSSIAGENKYLFDSNAAKEDLNDWEVNMLNVKEVNELLKEARRRFSEQESNINTWLFERAQHRADSRENVKSKEATDLNWYLRRSKEMDFESSPSSYFKKSPETEFDEKRNN